MSIRSYKQIYQKFEDLFPELASRKSGWKGIRFKERYILIEMKDGSYVHFSYFDDSHWDLCCTPWKLDSKENHACG